MKTLHQTLKEKEVEKRISNSETIVTERVCSWKVSVLMNKCTSPHLQKIIPTKRKSVWIVTIFSGILEEGLLFAKLKRWGETGKEGRGVCIWLNLSARSSCNGCVLGSGQLQRPLLCTDTNPQFANCRFWIGDGCSELHGGRRLGQPAGTGGGSGCAVLTAQGLLPPSALPAEPRAARSFPGSLGPSQRASFC